MYDIGHKQVIIFGALLASLCGTFLESAQLADGQGVVLFAKLLNVTISS
jgi:hypothetical protein